MTTGRDVARSGAALLAFSAVGLLYVRFLVPRLNDAMRFPAWRKAAQARRLSYGLFLSLAVFGTALTAAGLIGWAAGWTFP